jgi:transcription-repair coupling factor (superfamily II helicase)
LLDIDFTQLEEGDYVVHLQHGLGRYVGLRNLAGSSTASGPQECLVIEYAPREEGQPAPRLYVPMTEAHLVSKYVGAGKGRPPLNTLGGARWGKAKAEAAQAVRDLAAELLGLQAARATQSGLAFPEDVPWQREFEGAFLYEETPDQWRAIRETKADMEAPRPMDRLICGDVGFGKTEVAIRAAFKAVMAGRQVVILVPTTVLAQQHYNTFRERMADYPVRIDLLSRFRTRRQQEATLAALAAGAVDIVIGTHRLLQADVTFKDLGLVVVDEEQRFGVTHKERLKQMRHLVDVLTLTATPIPRTLYLALTGARDMSTIETPPQDRLPVETIVAAYDERLIRDAIQRELDRGGQVFYLHNRVFDIAAVAAKLAALVPAARIAVGHGQMKAEELEEVMTRFVNGEADVLLSTTIIESGIDIPNANTILIDRADRFGLSDLYQLRGRVGRYKHQAYAYLLIPRHAGLLTDARKRITAIKQFSTPGSGYKIAMRDLEIRGAGNLLGAAQSGHITAVGFALYCQLLEHSIQALKGETRPGPPAVTLRLDFLEIGVAGPPDPATRGRGGGGEAALRAQAAFLPGYVPETRHRVELYRRLAQLPGKAALDRLESEVRDRFGPPDTAAQLLFQATQLRLVAAERGIHTIETQEGKVMLRRGEDYVMAGGRFPRLTKREPKARLTEIRKLLLLLPPATRPPAPAAR